MAARSSGLQRRGRPCSRPCSRPSSRPCSRQCSRLHRLASSCLCSSRRGPRVHCLLHGRLRACSQACTRRRPSTQPQHPCSTRPCKTAAQARRGRACHRTAHEHRRCCRLVQQRRSRRRAGSATARRRSSASCSWRSWEGPLLPGCSAPPRPSSLRQGQHQRQGLAALCGARLPARGSRCARRRCGRPPSSNSTSRSHSSRRAACWQNWRLPVQGWRRTPTALAAGRGWRRSAATRRAGGQARGAGGMPCPALAWLSGLVQETAIARRLHGSSSTAEPALLLTGARLCACR